MMSEEEAFLRHEVSDLQLMLPFELTKFDFTRWLEAGGGDVARSRRMLRHHLNFVVASTEYPFHPSLREYTGWSIPGAVDRWDNVMLIHFVGAMDAHGMERNKFISGGDICIFQANLLVEASNEVRRHENIHGRRFGIHIVYDFEHLRLSLKELVKNTQDIYGPFIKFLDNHCKGMIRRLTLVNCPNIFTFFWPICQTFMPAAWISRCNLWNVRDLKKGLLEAFNEDQIPGFYGGSLEVPSNRVNWPSRKIPIDWYISDQDKTGIDGSPLSSWTVEPGKALMLQLHISSRDLKSNASDASSAVPKISYKIYFSMSCEFGIFLSPSKELRDPGQMKMMIPHMVPLAAPRRLPEHGVIEVHEPGYYNVLFDNNRAMFFRLGIKGDIICRFGSSNFADFEEIVINNCG